MTNKFRTPNPSTTSLIAYCLLENPGTDFIDKHYLSRFKSGWEYLYTLK